MTSEKVPNQDMVKILNQNKCKCMYRVDGPTMYLWVQYGDAIRKESKAGLDIWGNSDQILENVKKVVFHYYPGAEMTAQSGNKNVTFSLNS